MATPELRSVPAAEGLAFEVTAPGEVHGLRVDVGDRLLCGPTPRLRDLVVLAPRGRGTPVVGLKEGARLYGPARERCHPARWLAAGRVEGVWRAATGRVEVPSARPWAATRRAAPGAPRVSSGAARPVAPRVAPSGTRPAPAGSVAPARLRDRQLPLFPPARRAA